VLIPVVCPACGESYKVHEALRGKSMRCQRPTCRRVFLIDDTPPSASTPAPRSSGQRQSGSVGDVIPLLPVEEAEAVEDADRPPVAPHVGDLLEVVPSESAEAPQLPLEAINPDSAVAPPGWTEAPPARRTRSPRKTEVPEAPRVVEAGSWEAPPVRRGQPEPAPRPAVVDELEEVGESGEEALEEVPEVGPEPAPHEEHVHRPRARWAKWVVAALLLVTVTALGAGGIVAYRQYLYNEEKLSAKADEEYDKGQFLQASELYEQVAKRFPNSEHADRYTFRKDLSDLRKRLAEPSADLFEELDHAEQFLDERAKDQHLPDDAAALGNDLVRVLVGFVENANKDLKDDEPLKTLERAGPVIAKAKRVKPKDGKAPAWPKVDEEFRKLRDGIALMKARKKELDELRAIAKNATFRDIVALENRLKEIEPRFPDLPGSPEVRGLMKQQRDAHQASVRFVPGGAQAKPAPPEDQEPILLLNPLLEGDGAPGRSEGIGLALARGLLCAVTKKKGEVRWARRVGIDTTALPVRVPARAGGAERLLVPSSDPPYALTALDLNGNTLWRYELQSPMLGRPVVVDQRALLPTYNNGIHEIELIQGKLLGRYEVGQRLALGGVLEPGTRRVYFAADDGCVFILDTAERRCTRILYTRHPAGSLRGEPIVVPPHGEDGPGFLILNQADGLEGIRLRVFDLPVESSDARELPLRPPATLEGWTWFDPYQDPEKLILLSDAGRIGLFGIKQAHNRDQAVFPLLPGGSLDLGPMLFPNPAQVSRARGRSEIVQAQGDDLWVLASDRLQRLRLAWGNAVGPKVVPVWRDAVPVGSPIHASQALDDFGRTSLLTVTQPPRRSCVEVSHLDDDNGKLFWRRQLGVVCQGEPVPLPIDGGPPVQLACDQAGSLFALDPTRLEPVRGNQKLFRSPNVRLKDSLEENPDFPPLLLPAADGKSAYELACPGNGLELVVRHVKPSGAGRQLEVTEGKVALLQRLKGRPAIVGPHLLLAFADGSMARLPLPLPESPPIPEGGPDWRAERADPEARCHIVALGGSRFLTTDGALGLTVREWDVAGTDYKVLPADRDPPTLVMPGRVTGMALVSATPSRVAVTDTTKKLTLLEVQPNGALVQVGSWNLEGQATAEPFVRETKAGPRIGCVVDRTRLLWIDPAAKEPAWAYATPGDNAIVGEPRLVGDELVVADGSGLYVSLDARTGKEAGPGYRLKGSMAPATSPVEFQKGRLLAPLSDGTQMLLGLEKLKGK
jgi:hypothetical protein